MIEEAFAILVLGITLYWPILHFVRIIHYNNSRTTEEHREYMNYVFEQGMMMEEMKRLQDMQNDMSKEKDVDNRGYT